MPRSWKNSSSNGGPLRRQELRRDFSCCAPAGGFGRRPTPDANYAEAPPEVPGLVALGSSQDDAVSGRAGRSTKATVDSRPMAPVSLSVDDGVESARDVDAALRGHRSAVDSR